MTTRTVADLTDDEIVDAIASFGLEGVNMYNVDDFELFMKRVGAVDDLSRECVDLVSSRLESLFYLGRVGRDQVWTPSVFEWGKRLAGHTADEIAQMLAGAR